MSESWAMLTLRTRRRKLKSGTQRLLEKLYFEHRRSERTVTSEEVRDDLQALEPGVLEIIDKRIPDREAKEWLLKGLNAKERDALEQWWVVRDVKSALSEALTRSSGSSDFNDPIWFRGSTLVEALTPDDYSKDRSGIYVGWMRNDSALFAAYMKKVFLQLGFDDVLTHLGDDYEDGAS